MSVEIHDDAAMRRVRELVGEFVTDGVPPIVVAYCLVYSAVEFGLDVESDAKRVLSTLMGAMALATQDAVVDADGGVEAQCAVPDGVTKQ